MRASAIVTAFFLKNSLLRFELWTDVSKAMFWRDSAAKFSCVDVAEGLFFAFFFFFFCPFSFCLVDLALEFTVASKSAKTIGCCVRNSGDYELELFRKSLSTIPRDSV